MQKEYITINSTQTQQLGRMLAEELRGGEIICLTGELGAGKTTFTQGLLQGLGVEGPYTSPTFVVMKQYHVTHNVKREPKGKESIHVSRFTIHDVYHIDAYRVGADDIISLGWEEIISSKENVTIVEWADRIRDIIPEGALWIEFSWIDEDKRKIVISNIQLPISNKMSNN